MPGRRSSACPFPLRCRFPLMVAKRRPMSPCPSTPVLALLDPVVTAQDAVEPDLHTKSGGCLDVERHHMIGAMPAERLKELMAEHLATVHRTPYVIEFVHFHHDMFKVELPITKCGEAVVARIAAVEMALNIGRSEEHTSELQSLMRISYAVFCLQKKHLHTH